MMHSFSTTQKTGAGVLLLLVMYAFLGPMLQAGDAATQNLNHILTPPNSEFWFGTDHFGRNMWIRLASALQLSLMMASSGGEKYTTVRSPSTGKTVLLENGLSVG